MRESGWYPPGTEFKADAPWNQVDVPEKEFDVTISQSLSKSVTVVTNDYIPGASGVDYEPNEEGGYSACGWHDPDDTSNTAWGKAYREEHYTPLDLIDLLCKKCKQELNELENLGSEDAPYYYAQKKRELEHLIDECECWTEDECEVVEG